MPKKSFCLYFYGFYADGWAGEMRKKGAICLDLRKNIPTFAGGNNEAERNDGKHCYRDAERPQHWV